MRKTLKSSFTILELLVVIAIISILACMLLPALAKAKNKVKSTQCMSNQKNIFLAISSYCGDFNTLRIPQSIEYTFSDYFPSLLMEYGYLKNNRAVAIQGVFSCPSEKRYSGTVTEWNMWKGSHYGINWFLTYRSTSSSEPYLWKPNQNIPVSQSKVMYFGDNIPGWTCTLYYGEEPRDMILPSYFRHEGNKRMNCVFLDGHALNGGADKIPTEKIVGENKLGRYYFFCQRNLTAWLDM